MDPFKMSGLVPLLCSVLVLLGGGAACSRHVEEAQTAASVDGGRRGQPVEPDVAAVSKAPPRDTDPRAQRLIDGLEGVVQDLRSGAATPEEAFDRLGALRAVVGPPAIEIPPVEIACSTDSDCALTDLSIDVASGYACCPGLRHTAGTTRWIGSVEERCRTYEPLRGRDPDDLPGCGIYTGPLDANVARCRASRCIPCLSGSDGVELCRE